MDLACFFQHPDSGQGPEHAGCARQCIKKGLPIGLKTGDGTLYLLMAPGHESLRDRVAEHAGNIVTVEGQVIETGALKAFIVKEIGKSGGG